MTSTQVNQTSTNTEVGVVPGSEADSVGPALRRLREAKHITPAEACRRLKFSQRQLEALESEQWDKLPTGMSLRGFVKNYARYLETDVDAILTLLDNQIGPPPSVFVAPTARRTPPPTDLHAQEDLPRRPWGWLLVILIVVFVAAFYAIDRGWVPDSWLIFDWLKSLKS